MSTETIRILNSSLFGLLVFAWTLWLMYRLDSVRSRLIAGLVIPVWCWLSMSAYDAARHDGPLATRLTYVGPFVLVPLLSALVYDTILRPPRPHWVEAVLRLLKPTPFDDDSA
jgi:hypothetical protein